MSDRGLGKRSLPLKRKRAPLGRARKERKENEAARAVKGGGKGGERFSFSDDLTRHCSNKGFSITRHPLKGG